MQVSIISNYFALLHGILLFPNLVILQIKRLLCTKISLKNIARDIFNIAFKILHPLKMTNSILFLNNKRFHVSLSLNFFLFWYSIISRYKFFIDWEVEGQQFWKAFIHPINGAVKIC